MSEAAAAPIPFGPATPVLRVSNVEASVQYYTKALGFTFNWGHNKFASVRRGKCEVFLCEGDQGHPGSWLWIGVSDVESLFAHLRNSGARIRHAPSNFPWALEMQVEDLDGNILRFGSDPKKDEPWGEWLDMNGHRWRLERETWVKF